MRRHSYRAAWCLAACAWLLIQLGCTKDEGIEETASSSKTEAVDDATSERPDESIAASDDSTVDEQAHDDATPPEETTEPPPPANPVIPLDVGENLPDPVMPKVIMTETHAATCQVKVGDEMPDFTLDDLEGNQHTLGDVAGEKLTVIFFWNCRHIITRNALEDLQYDVWDVRQGQGVNVVGIDVGDSPDQVREMLAAAEVKFTTLLDPNGEYFAQVATGLLPRVYLLGPGRKVRWFDLEYSLSTRRQLLEAIRFMLEMPSDAAGAESKSGTDGADQ